MKKFILAGSCLLLALPLASCQEEVTNPDGMSKMATRSSVVASNVAGPDRASAHLPGLVSDIRGAGANALNPADYACPVSTPINDWFVDAAFEIINAEPVTFDLLYNQLLTDLIPTYEALLFETTATPQYFGYKGEYTRIMTKTERDVKKFWDINSAGIQVLGMHGTVLLDQPKVAATYEAVFGVPHGTAVFFASLVHDAVANSTTIHGGNHPLFTFNSVAYSDGSIPDKIVMGDGILAGYTALGYGDVAPQAIFAHEFAHHIQYQRDYFNDAYATSASPAEQTQYTEMMADAMSAYFLTHSRGTAMNRKRVAQFLEVFYEIGDCAFSDPGHHGTPNQRMRAANFGFDMADQAQKQGHILTSAAFHDAFVAAYPAMVAPDAH